MVIRSGTVTFPKSSSNLNHVRSYQASQFFDRDHSSEKKEQNTLILTTKGKRSYVPVSLKTWQKKIHRRSNVYNVILGCWEARGLYYAVASDRQDSLLSLNERSSSNSSRRRVFHRSRNNRKRSGDEVDDVRRARFLTIKRLSGLRHETWVTIAAGLKTLLRRQTTSCRYNFLRGASSKAPAMGF